MTEIDEYGTTNELLETDDLITKVTSRLVGKALDSWRKRHVTIRAFCKGFKSPIRDVCECPEKWKDLRDVQWHYGVEAGYACRIAAMGLFVSVIGIAVTTQILKAGIF
jgi:hypothetical protein